jgi:uncharacterized protein (UPF0248 family)
MSQESALPGAAGVQGLAAACLLGALLAWLALAPRHFPAPAAGDTPPPSAGFSVARAQAHVQALAAAPRPIASHANAQARDYLLAQLRAIGLEPEVQTEMVRTASSDLTANVRVTLAEVHNVVVRKPGVVSGHGGRPAVLALHDTEGSVIRIPLHRVRRVWRDGVIFWERRTGDALQSTHGVDPHD